MYTIPRQQTSQLAMAPKIPRMSFFRFVERLISQRRWNNLKGFKDFYLEGTGRIWP